MYTHQVSVSLQERSLCPSCGEDVLTKEDDYVGPREQLVCLTCNHTEPATFRRWRMLYPKTPTSKYDVFRSLEKLDNEGKMSVEFAIDIDRGGEEAARQVHRKLEEIAGDVFDVYSSGSKGFHIHIPFAKWKYGNEQWPAVFKQLAANLDILGVIDTAIYMRNAMYRVEGSINTKSGRKKTLIHEGTLPTPLSSWGEAVSKAQQDAERQAPARYAGGTSGESTTFRLLQDYVPPCIQALWLSGLPAPGTRHMSYLHLISYHYRRGDSLEECLESLTEFAEEHEENTTSSRHSRVSEAERLTHLAYQQGITFECSRGRDLGICEVQCKLFK